MKAQINIEEIRKITAEQHKKFDISNKNLLDMLLTEEVEENWDDNYHLIDHDYIVKWKNSIGYDDLNNKNNNCKKIGSSDNKEINIEYKNKEVLTLSNNKTIYYDNKKLINPLKSFDLITDEVWKLFDLKNENINFNGKVSILKGNRKILIRFDENNYCVKYLTNNDIDDLFGEFIIIFDSDKKDKKDSILRNLSKSNIYEWMKEIEFENSEQFKVNKYSIPFEIKQKKKNFIKSDISFNIDRDCINEACNYVSFSKISYNISCNYDLSGDFLSKNEFITFLSDISDLRTIQKFEQTSNIISVMRCLSMICPLVDYFTCSTKGNKIFSKFQSFSLINLIRDFFQNIWNKEKTPYKPEDFTRYIKKKTDINILEEQDPYNFLIFILKYINTKLNNIDRDFNNFDDLIKIYENEKYYNEINKIIKKNNNIIGTNFLGLILENYKCNNSNCTKNTNIIKPFYIIEIDYLELINYLHKKGNSITTINIDFLLKYYFLEETIKEKEYPSINCPVCGKKAIVDTKKILVYPKYLIIRLKIDKFQLKRESINDSFILDLNNNYDEVEGLNNYCSNRIKKHIQYELISMINYLYNENNDLRFSSICRLINNGETIWVSFYPGSKPKKLKGDYKNNVSQPYLLFYQLIK